MLVFLTRPYFTAMLAARGAYWLTHVIAMEPLFVKRKTTARQKIKRSYLSFACVQLSSVCGDASTLGVRYYPML